MKENWINKLVDLLNEYEKEKTDLKFNPHLWDAYGGHLSFLEYSSKYSDLLCISKRYEFIKRLVENDKIDMSKAKYYSDLIYYEDYWEWGWACKDYEFVIMLLSIKDKPIEFLLSVLK